MTHWLDGCTVMATQTPMPSMSQACARHTVGWSNVELVRAYWSIASRVLTVAGVDLHSIPVLHTSDVTQVQFHLSVTGVEDVSVKHVITRMLEWDYAGALCDTHAIALA